MVFYYFASNWGLCKSGYYLFGSRIPDELSFFFLYTMRNLKQILLAILIIPAIMLYIFKDTVNPLVMGAAILPAVILLVLMLIQDKERPEPFKQLFKGVGYGGLSALLAVMMVMPLAKVGVLLDAESFSNVWEAVWTAFGTAAIPEETAKLLCLYLLLRKNKYFDEYFDGIVYATTIGLGFAAFENVGYLVQAEENWPFLAVTRGLLSVPGHFFFAVLMGYYYSLAHFGHNRKRNLLMMWAVPVLAHGIFDAMLMTLSVAPGWELAFGIAFLLFCNELRKLGQRRIRELQEADNDFYNRNPFS